MLVTGKELLKEAQKNGYAVPSPDFWDSASARVFVQVAEKLHQPVILSFAEIHKDHLSLEEAAAIGRFYAESVSVPVALHLDHGTSLEFIKKAIDLGFTSVMIDASAKDFDENVRITKEAVEYAHRFNIPVEAEIGHVGSEDEEGPHVISASTYTEPAMAAEFVRQTGADSIAVSIGTSHGAYKNGTPHINFDILKEIRKAVDVPLVLHGGSGSGDENLSECARLGICKVNIYTDYIKAAREAAMERPYGNWLQVLDAAEKAVAEVHEHYYHVLNCVK